MSRVIRFPKWRENATPIEKLEELLQYARSHPEDVTSLIVMWIDSDAEFMWGFSGAPKNAETVGQIEITKLKILGLHTHSDEA
jgi:hypothetical protein